MLNKRAIGVAAVPRRLFIHNHFLCFLECFLVGQVQLTLQHSGFLQIMMRVNIAFVISIVLMKICYSYQIIGILTSVYSIYRQYDSIQVLNTFSNSFSKKTFSFLKTYSICTKRYFVMILTITIQVFNLFLAKLQYQVACKYNESSNTITLYKITNLVTF